MSECRCPKCNTVFDYSFSDFGQLYRCSSCNIEFRVDTTHFVHYVLPNIIKIQLLDKKGAPFVDFSVPISIEYGYYIPPLVSDTFGQIAITKELMKQAEHDHRSTGIMDYRYDDYSLNRYIIIRVLNREAAIILAKGRMSSPWPVSSLEKKLYGTKEKAVWAFVPVKQVVPAEALIDLSDSPESVRLEIKITPI